MSENFPDFADALARRLDFLSQHELFQIDHTDLNAAYLAAFPAGTNPIFRVRTWHDCACCRNFVKNFGGVFAIIDGKRETLWNSPDFDSTLPEPYDVVAARMHGLVMQGPIKGIFRTKEKTFGSKPNLDNHNPEIRWEHFFGSVRSRFQCNKPDEVRGQKNTDAQVFERGLQTLTTEALSTVIDAIQTNSLYRGAEFLSAVREFAAMKDGYMAAPDAGLFVWANVNSPAARFRNTAIGTLVTDLSEGVAVDDAVRMFESKVAPLNYKRTTALITPRMVEAAQAKLAELGLEDTIYRRFAHIDDVSVNDVLFVDNAVRGRMRDNVWDAVQSAAKPIKPPSDAGLIEIGAEEFFANIVPAARKIEAFVKNTHANNFVSLTAPQHANAGRLFKWNNDFAWSYAGEVTDSIKARVKRAGGKTDAPLRVSLSWSNTDDLDLHAICPDGHIYYRDKLGILDVDMNAGFNLVRDPVENLSWTRPRDGHYEIYVNQYSRRETIDVGFSIEIECNGNIDQFNYDKALKSGDIQCIRFEMRNGEMYHPSVNQDLVGGSVSRETWGVKTESFVPVQALMLSPNYWHGAGSVGNKHWFFVLQDCVNPDPVRGIYNDYLRGELTPHRKVFEVLATKTKCAPDSSQLSGVGFSSTKRDSLVVKVTGDNSTRAYKINF